jgi:hypothetical protein
MCSSSSARASPSCANCTRCDAFQNPASGGFQGEPYGLLALRGRLEDDRAVEERGQERPARPGVRVVRPQDGLDVLLHRPFEILDRLFELLRLHLLSPALLGFQIRDPLQSLLPGFDEPVTSPASGSPMAASYRASFASSRLISAAVESGFSASVSRRSTADHCAGEAERAQNQYAHSAARAAPGDEGHCPRGHSRGWFSLSLRACHSSRCHRAFGEAPCVSRPGGTCRGR